jgi:hypothetical protein
MTAYLRVRALLGAFPFSTRAALFVSILTIGVSEFMV